MSASLSGGVLLYGSFTGKGVWSPGGGTSAACPEFAGIVAIADQYAGKSLGFLNPTLYRLEAQKAPGIVDVVHGNNTVSFSQDGKTVTVKGYSATPGYDLVTGVGTIDGIFSFLNCQRNTKQLYESGDFHEYQPDLYYRRHSLCPTDETEQRQFLQVEWQGRWFKRQVRWT